MKYPFILTLLSFTLTLFVLSGCGAGDGPSPAPEQSQVAAVPTQAATVTAVPPTPTPESTPTAQASQGDSLAPAQESQGDTLAPPETEAGEIGVISFTSVRGDNPDDEEIYLMDSNGENLRNLTNNPARDGTPDWSPDGKLIAWSSTRDGNREIYVMQRDGSGVRRLTNEAGDDTMPDWSPDGTMLAFTSERDGNEEIYVMNAAGSNLRRLTNSPADETMADWSPDGSRLLFRSDQAGNRDIFVMNADGSNVISLTTDPAHDSRPRWSPDGTLIVWTSERDGNREIYLMNSDGSEVRRLTDNPADDDGPVWSPDGQTLLWYSDRSGDTEIYAMTLDGGQVRRLTNNPGDDLLPKVQPNPAPRLAFGGQPVADPMASLTGQVLPVPSQPFDLTNSEGTTLVESSDQILSLDLTPDPTATTRIEKSATVQILVNPTVDLAQVNGRCESNLINALPLILDLSWSEAAEGWEYNLSIAAVAEQGQPVAWLAATPGEPDPDVTRPYSNPYCNQWAGQELSAESGFTVEYPAPHKLWLGGVAGQPVTVTFNIRARRAESTPEQTATEAPASPEAAQILFPTDAQMQDSFLDEKTNDMRGEFLTGLSAAELVEFYGQVYPPAAGWRLIRPEPSSAEVEAGSFGSFFLQNETREIAFYLEAAAEGAGLKVEFSTGPLADYADANLPTDIEPLAALIGDAKDANVIPLDNNMTTVVFSSRKPVTEIIEAYRTGLPGLGWQIVAEDQTLNQTTLIIEKAGQQWRLMMGAEFNSTVITLMGSQKAASAPSLDPADVTGDLYLAGSNSSAALTYRVIERFQTEGFQGGLALDLIGTENGFERLCLTGETDIVPANRPIEPSEAAGCRDILRQGVSRGAPFGLTVGYDPEGNPIILYSVPGAIEKKPAVAAFLNFYLEVASDEIADLGQGFSPASSEELDTARQTLQSVLLP
ncbi:MAG: hypothetical protein L6R45_03455 [Anaerolineae bacterium]|nr:hypothetical protein [Anaerolineae bacterium]